MVAALELIVLPAILLTLILVVLLFKTGLDAAGIAATAVFIGLLYFFIIKLLRQLRRWDHEQAVRERKAFVQAEREGEQAEREAREQAEHEAPHPA